MAGRRLARSLLEFGTLISSMTNLSDRLNQLIESIERSARTAKMISFNAGVIAVRTRSATNESYAFEAVAEQIKSISDESVRSIASLRQILRELHQLSSTINLAGRQRMLSQKVMKLHLLRERSVDHSSRQSVDSEIEALVALFERSLSQLMSSPLNTRDIDRKLEETQLAWQAFIQSLERPDLALSAELNDRVLAVMNDAVTLYETLGGR